MTVTPEERDEMARILMALSGKTAPVAQSSDGTRTRMDESDQVISPGVTQKDVRAMHDVLKKLNSVSNQVVDGMISESNKAPIVSEALNMERTADGVKIGRYQILIKEDASRVAGKQYYSIYNSLTQDIIASDISLYETALGAVRLLNKGLFANSKEVMNLFEQDAQYTSHRVDAILFKRRMLKTADEQKRDIYESRYQASLDRCMAVKKVIKATVK